MGNGASSQPHFAFQNTEKGSCLPPMVGSPGEEKVSQAGLPGFSPEAVAAWLMTDSARGEVATFAPKVCGVQGTRRVGGAGSCIFSPSKCQFPVYPDLGVLQGELSVSFPGTAVVKDLCSLCRAV